MSVFEELNLLNINGHTEKKKVGGTELTYLSWPWAWAEVKKRYPAAHYEIWKDANGRPYAHDPLTGYMVYTTVTIDGESHSMWLPVMDGANNAMKSEPYEYTVNNPKFRYAKWDEKRGGYFDSYGNEQPEKITKRVETATMFDVNKTIMRCLVKNLAMFGLGLYIYAGEDLPEGETDDIPRTGSKEAAEEAGRAKLERLNAQAAQAAEKPATTKRNTTVTQLATEEQKQQLRSMVNVEQMASCNKMYGEKWERMPENAALTLIKKCKQNIERDAENYAETYMHEDAGDRV